MYCHSFFFNSIIIFRLFQSINQYSIFIAQSPSSSVCCFRYGFGAQAIPCCLETITCDEHDKLVEENKENPIAGGAFGKHKVCPKDAEEAHQLLSGKDQETYVQAKKYHNIHDISKL